MIAKTCRCVYSALFVASVAVASAQAADRGSPARAPFSSPTAVEQSDDRGDAPSSPVQTFAVEVSTTSYLAGTVGVRLNATDGSGAAAFFSVSLSDPNLANAELFDEFGGYTFTPPQQTDTLQAPAAAYAVTLEQNLTPAEAGLGTACDLLSGSSIVVTNDGSLSIDRIEIECGTPTQPLDPSVLEQARAAGSIRFDSGVILPAVLAGPELFAVCLGNGGSNAIYGFSDRPDSDLGTGVRFVEHLLTLPAMAASAGAGIDLYCNGLADNSAVGSVIDTPLWRYLVSLDVLRELHLAGRDEFAAAGAGGYGDAEIESLLAPYVDLLAAAALPYGALENTPTKRLRFLEYSYNNFSSADWTNLWRISEAAEYRVGDVRTSGNFGTIFSLGVQINLSDAAAALVQNSGAGALVRIEPGPAEFIEGLAAVLEFPLTESTAAVFGPFDVGEGGEDPLLVSIQESPSGLLCTSNATGELINGVSYGFNGVEYRPYGPTGPLIVDCDTETGNVTNRVRATFRFPREVSNFPLFDGTVQVTLIDSITNVPVVSRVAKAAGSAADFVFSVNNVPNGNYQIQVQAQGASTSFSYGCEGVLDLSFTVGDANTELGAFNCSEETGGSGLAGGLLANCLFDNGFQFLHQTEEFEEGSRLDCQSATGFVDFELLKKPWSLTTLDFSGNINAAAIDALAFAFPNEQRPSKIAIGFGSGIETLSNARFLSLVRTYGQVDTGDRGFPTGSGLVAQCLRNLNFAVLDDVQVLKQGDELACSGLGLAADFDVMAQYLRLSLFEESVWDFSNNNLSLDALDLLSDAVPGGQNLPLLRLGGNPGVGSMGNLVYLPFSESFEELDLGGVSFPNLIYIKAQDVQPNARFGSAVAMDGSGTTMIVGAPGHPVNGGERGKIYVLTKNTSTGDWSETATYQSGAVSGFTGQLLGESVAISDDGQFFAATRRTSNKRRVVEIFRLNLAFGSSLTVEETISGGVTNGESLMFVARNGGQTLVVGEPDGLTTGPQATGFVQVFSRSVVGGQVSWPLEKLYQPPASVADAGDRFGASLALNIEGGLIVGAPGDDSLNPETSAASFGTALVNNDAPDSGALYVYPAIDSGSTSIAYVKADPPGVAGITSQLGRLLAAESPTQYFASDDTVFQVSTPLFARFPGSVSTIEGSQIARIPRVVDDLQLQNGILVTSEQEPTLAIKIASIFGDEPLSTRLDLTPVITGGRAAADFGRKFSLSGDGNRLVFGASLDDGGSSGSVGGGAFLFSPDSGAVYVYP